MTGRGWRVLSGAPPLGVGVALAAAAEVSAALLLYSGPGLLRALSLVLAVQVGAAGLGLWSASARGRDRIVEAVRRRWLFGLITFTVAAVTSVAWQLLGGFAESRLGQGMGLALLGGLPILAGGALVGTLALPEAGLGPAGPVREARSGMPPETWTLLGMALGFLLTGGLLSGGVTPASILMGCVVVLSGGALVHARILLGSEEGGVVEVVASAWGEIRVEDDPGVPEGSPRRVLRVAGVLRGGRRPDGHPSGEDEEALLRGLERGGAPPERVLFLGGGAFVLPQVLLERWPEARAWVLEPIPELLPLARRHFGVTVDGGPAGPGRMEVLTREPARFGQADLPAPFHLVVVDSPALDPGRPAPMLSVDALRELRGLLALGGRLAFLRLGGASGSRTLPLATLVASCREAFPSAEIRLAGLGAGNASEGNEGRGLLVVMGEADPIGELPEFRRREAMGLPEAPPLVEGIPAADPPAAPGPDPAP